MNIVSRKNSKFNRFFFTLSLLFALGAAPCLKAQTKDQLHDSNPNFDKNKVHAEGITPAPKGVMETYYKTPEPLAEDGHHFDDVYKHVSWEAFFFSFLILFLCVYFPLRYKYKAGQKATYDTGENAWKYTLGFAVLFFIVADGYLIYHSITDTKKYFMNPPTGPDVVRVQVMPQQWLWNFRYAGNDNEFGTPDDIVTVNEMWIPKGKEISLQIKSKDVIHGFMVYELRRQIDAIPGAVTRFWFKPTRTGDFEIACMHLCGTAHYKMKGFMKVVEQEEFEAWTKEMSEWSEARYDANDTATHWGWSWLM